MTWMYIGMGRRAGPAPELPTALRAARALHVRPWARRTVGWRRGGVWPVCV